MKYSFITTSIALLSLGAGLMMSCSKELAEEPGNDTQSSARMYMRVAVAPPTTTETDANASSDAERTVDPSRLYLATYDNTGKLITGFYAGAETDDTKYYGNVGGYPEIATHLDYDDHKNGFTLVAYVLPKSHYTVPGTGFSFLNDIKSGNYTLSMPGLTGTTPTLWTPSATADEGDQIPMAGMVQVTASELAKYDAVIHRYSPFKLPDIMLTRAMAKIVIEDPDGIIDSATVNVADNGYLVPATSWWWDGGAKAPNSPTGSTLKGISNVKPKDGKIVFYSYEKALTVGVDHPGRAIATLTGIAGMKPDKKPLYLAPYDTKGKLKDSLTDDDLKTEDGGVWSGILRNHQYTFTVKRPAAGDFEIYVKTSVWIPERDSFEF